VGKMVVPKNLAQIEKEVAEAEQRNKVLKQNLEKRIANL